VHSAAAIFSQAVNPVFLLFSAGSGLANLNAILSPKNNHLSACFVAISNIEPGRPDGNGSGKFAREFGRLESESEP
jgi:hypothetical protein